MRYPCAECIVDAICINACNKLDLYIRQIDQTKKKSIPDDLTLNEVRCNRLIRINWSRYSYELYIYLNHHIGVRRYYKRVKNEISM